MKSKTQWIVLFIAAITCFYQCGSTHEREKEIHLSIREIFRLGMEEAGNKKEEPYEFGSIYNNYCDFDNEGRLYVLDADRNCVRIFSHTGAFITQYFSKGEGPTELSNPCGLAFNRQRNTLFVQNQYGFIMKEFTREGALRQVHHLPEQITNQILFIDSHEYAFFRNLDQEGKTGYQIAFANLETQKVRMKLQFSGLNDVFAYFSSMSLQRGVLFSFCYDTASLQQITPASGQMIRHLFPYPLRPPQLITAANWRGYFAHQYVQLCRIDQSIGLVVSEQTFENTNDLNSIKAPQTIRHTLYVLQGNRFESLGPIPQADGYEFAKVQHGNRLLFTRYHPFSQILCLEITGNG